MDDPVPFEWREYFKNGTFFLPSKKTLQVSEAQSVEHTTLPTIWPLLALSETVL